jgi:hypothetical protein
VRKREIWVGKKGCRTQPEKIKKTAKDKKKNKENRKKETARQRK